MSAQHLICISGWAVFSNGFRSGDCKEHFIQIIFLILIKSSSNTLHPVFGASPILKENTPARITMLDRKDKSYQHSYPQLLSRALVRDRKYHITDPSSWNQSPSKCEALGPSRGTNGCLDKGDRCEQLCVVFQWENRATLTLCHVVKAFSLSSVTQQTSPFYLYAHPILKELTTIILHHTWADFLITLWKPKYRLRMDLFICPAVVLYWWTMTPVLYESFIIFSLSL